MVVPFRWSEGGEKNWFLSAGREEGWVSLSLDVRAECSAVPRLERRYPRMRVFWCVVWSCEFQFDIAVSIFLIS